MTCKTYFDVKMKIFTVIRIRREKKFKAVSYTVWVCFEAMITEKTIN